MGKIAALKGACPLLCRWGGVRLGPQWLQPAGQRDHQPRTDPRARVHQPPEQEGDGGGLRLPPHHRPDCRRRGEPPSRDKRRLCLISVLVWTLKRVLLLRSGVCVGLQQLGPSGFGVYCQPADAPSGQQLPAEQSGGQHRLRSALLYGCSGQWRSNGSLHFDNF